MDNSAQDDKMVIHIEIPSRVATKFIEAKAEGFKIGMAWLTNFSERMERLAETMAVKVNVPKYPMAVANPDDSTKH